MTQNDSISLSSWNTEDSYDISESDSNFEVVLEDKEVERKTSGQAKRRKDTAVDSNEIFLEDRVVEKKVRRQKSYRLIIVNSGCHLSYPFLHFEINLHMSYQNRQLRVSFLIQYSPFSRSTFICHTIKFVLS